MILVFIFDFVLLKKISKTICQNCAKKNVFAIFSLFTAENIFSLFPSKQKLFKKLCLSKCLDLKKMSSKLEIP